MNLKIVTIIASVLIGLAIIVGAISNSLSSNDNNNDRVGRFSNVQDFNPSAELPLGNASIGNIQHQGNNSVILGCEIYGSLFCKPAESEFDSYLANAKVSKVYDVTSQKVEFVKGFQDDNSDNHEAIRLYSYNEDYVVASNTTGLDTHAFTVSFWTKKDPNAFNYGHIVSYADRHATQGWFFDTGKPEVQSARFVITNTNGTALVSSDITLPEGKWINIVGTFDGKYQRVYANGDLLDQKRFIGKYGAPTPDIPLKMGNAAYCYSCAPWGGSLDDLSIFNKALSGAEVKLLYNLDQSLTDDTGNTDNAISKSNAATLAGYSVGQWNFDGNLDDSSRYHRETEYFTPTAGMAFAPDGRLFFTEKNTGNIRIIDNDMILDRPFATVPDLKASIMFGLLGITLDPAFQQNHYVYAYYSSFKKNDPQQAINRVVRYTDNENEGMDMHVILDNIPAYNAFHSGGALAFGPDGKLYITVGEGNEAPFALDPNILLGKVLRINKDGSIPSDNPDPGSPVFSIGHRNMFGIAFDPTKTNSDGEPVGIVTENGDRLYDEINILHKGGNYGWPLLQAANEDPHLANNRSIKPARSYLLPIAPTQSIFYTGNKFPELEGMFVFGSYNSPRVFALKLDERGEKVVKELDFLPDYGLTPTMAIAQSPTGDIYLGGHKIYKLSSIGVDKMQIVFPVQLNMSSPKAEFKGLSLVENTMVIQIDPAGSLLSNISLKIPKNLIDGFKSVVATSASGDKTELDFMVTDYQPSRDYNTVTIDTSPVGSANKQLTITLTALRITPR